MLGSLIKHRWIRHVALVLALAIVAGCEKGKDRAAATQVAAKVNSDEITVHQIDTVLAQSPNLAMEDAPAAKREILNRLIDQQIAVQQARQIKLDRSPSFLMAVEAAQAEFLARAYAESIARSLPKPSTDEVKKYYADHPELFSRRRVYALETISVSAPEELVSELKGRIAKTGSTKEITEWLKSKDARFAENSVVRNAEEIPLEMLAEVHAMKNGEIRVFDQGGGRLEVIRVVETKPAPVDEATATPRIQQFLFNRTVNEAMGREMKRLKVAARIEYLGEFAGDAVPGKITTTPDAKAKGEVQPGPVEASKERKSTAVEIPPDGQAKDPSNPSQLLQKSIEKGVRGLR